MSSKTDVVQGALKLKGLLEEYCIKSAAELVKAIPDLFTVEIPASVTNVVISSQQPGDDQRQSLWVRQNTNGGFIGIYVYSAGNWQVIFPLPTQLVKVYGKSTDATTFPKGYILATDSVNLNTSQKNYLKSFWHWYNDDPTSGYYDIFEVIFTGF